MGKPPYGRPWPIEVTLTGEKQDVIKFALGGGGPNDFCIPAASYQDSRDKYDTFFSGWYACGRPEVDMPPRPIEKMFLNSNWNGARAVFVQICPLSDYVACARETTRWRGYYVLGQ